MRVLLVNHLLDAVTGGGTAERTFQIARFLQRQGVQCTILTLDIGNTADRQQELADVRMVAAPCINQRFFIPKLSSSELQALVADADVVHLSGHWTVLNARVFLACRKLGKPYLFNPAGALRPFGRSLLIKRLYNAWVGSQIATSAARCIAITQDERADFLAFGVPDERICVIPNGIDPEQYAHTVRSRDAACADIASGLKGAPYVLFLGRLNHIKGPDLLLEAFAAIASRFPEHHLVMAGPDGGLLETLRARALAHSLQDRVHFSGFISGAKKSEALRFASLLAIPSRREAMSIVVLEAGACGCPVLFTDACGLSEIAQAGAGIMVAVSTDALIAGLAQALDSPQQQRHSAQVLAHIVADEYLWQVQAARYASLCNDILSERA
ncbi:glycosyltransferase [Hydrogenophaga sp.]|uniref:glycosyltransferase n=1 Tax=Hydrogenophaga sp. TaxID=1904254 RepID=UPI002FC966FD